MSHGVRGAAHDARDIGRAETAEVVQDDHLALHRRQAIDELV
jgi:hypothetical protein